MGEDMPEEKRGAVKKRRIYHIRHEPRIPDMQQGLHGLLSQAEHLFPFGNEGIPVPGDMFAVPVEIQAGMNNPGRRVFLPRMEGKEHHFIGRVGSQVGRHSAEPAGVIGVTKEDTHIPSTPVA